MLEAAAPGAKYTSRAILILDSIELEVCNS